MSFEILESPQQTVYAPLNTTIDADRDYYSLTGLDACACGGGAIQARAQLGPGPHPAEGSQPNGGVSGYYSQGHLPSGMYAPEFYAPDLEHGFDFGDNAMLWVLAGVVGLWAFWAWNTAHEPMQGL